MASGSLPGVLAAALFFWLGRVAAPGADAPFITRHPVDQRAGAGEKVRLACGVESVLAPVFEWQRNGRTITGANQSFLDLDNAQPMDSGTYQMIARNAGGAAFSRLCHVRVLLPELRPGAVDPDFFTGTVGQGDVLALAADGSGFWLGGEFRSINGLPRPYLARVGAGGGPAPGFNPGSGPDGQVNSIAVHGNGILAGGDFQSVNGRVARGLVRLDRNGRLFPPDASPADRLAAFSGTDGPVRFVLALPGGNIVIAGGFATVNDRPAAGMALLSPDGSMAPGFTPPSCNGEVRTVVRLSDGTLLLGGNFTSPRLRLLRIHAVTGVEVPFPGGHAAPDGEVRALAVQSDGGIVIGGEFIRLFGVDRKYLGRLLPGGGLDSDFRANVTGTLVSGLPPRIYALQTDAAGRILAGGNFTAVKGSPRPGLVRLLPSGAVDPAFMPPVFSRAVRALAAAPDGSLIAGGEFDWPRSRMLKVLGAPPAAAAPQLLMAEAGVDPPSGGTVSAGGAFRTAAPASYQWRRNGLLLPGRTRRELFLDAAAPSDTGQYTVEAVTAAGATSSPPLPVVVRPPPSAGIREYGFPAPFTLPLPVSEGSTTESVITVAGALTIDKIAVRVDIRHADTSELFAQLVAPGGQSYTLFSQPGHGGADFDQTVLDSEAPFTLEESGAPWLGTLRPADSLAGLSGKSAAGTWRLRLQDLRPDNGLTGQLLGWTLLVRTHEAQTYAAWSSVLPPGVSQGPLEDADGDGLPNLLECALAGEAPEWVIEDGRLVFHFSRWMKSAGFHLGIQSSRNLLDWSPAAAPLHDMSVMERRAGGTERIRVTVRPDGMASFFRLSAGIE